MKIYKKWFIIVTSVLILGRLSLMVVNVVVDPFEVFQTNFFQYETLAMNVRFVKIAHLKKNNSKYNSYLLGSSRVGLIHPEVLEKYIPDSKFYNLWVSNGNMLDNLKHLEYFIRKSFEVKNIFLLIDMDHLVSTADLSKKDYVRKLHPEVDGSSKPKFYFEYLRLLPYENIKKKIKQNRRKRNIRDSIDVENSGFRYKNIQDAAIKKDHDNYMKRVKALNVNKVDRVKYRFNSYMIRNTIELLKQILRHCRSKGINLIVAITPHNYNKLNSFDTNGYINFLKELSEITPFWDFAGYNSVTLDNKLYYETSHFRPVVGEMMLAKIYNGKEFKVPTDFGFYVTKKNIDEHLHEIKKGFNYADVKFR